MQSGPEHLDGSFGLGGDMLGVADQFGYNNLNTNNQGTANAHLADYGYVKKQPHISSTVTFSDTGTYISETVNQSSNNAGYVTVICGASFKFRDPAQQDAYGLPNFNITYDAGGIQENGIIEALVINDLRIRIRNVWPAAVSGYDGNWMDYTSSGTSMGTGVGAFPLRNPLWAIKNIKIKKGFGVVAPSTASQPFVADTGTGQVYVAPVPDLTIPAWTEVHHASNKGFGTGSAGLTGSGWEVDDGGASTYAQQRSGGTDNVGNPSGVFGNDRGHQTVDIDGIVYSTPNTAPVNHPGAELLASPGSTFNRVTVFGDPDSAEEDGNHVTGNNYQGKDVFWNNSFFHVSNTSSTQQTIISRNITGRAWEADTWY